eukprot:jgi/Phyca11/9721/fgenesh1_pm.PHYCAscaffold_41_\
MSGAQLTTISQVQEAATLLQPRRVAKTREIQAPNRILLAEQQLESQFGKDLFSFISLPIVSASLVVLDLSFNELDDDFWIHWTSDLRDAKWPTLTTLNLANNQFSARGMDAISTFIRRCPGLFELDMSLNLFSGTDSSCDWLNPLIKALDEKDRGYLQVLDVSCTGLTDQGFSQLLEAAFISDITKLYLRSNALTDKAAMALAKMLPKMKLEVLSLAGNKVGDTGAASIAFVLDQTPALQTLDLDENQIGKAGINCFFHAINGMEGALDLSGNEIGERGAHDVGLFLALQPPLRLLNLSNNLITDRALGGLAQGLEPNAKLQELLLDQNQITDAGAKQLYLKAFQANPQRRIRLSLGNPLTSECKVMLAAISQAHDLRKRFANEFYLQEYLDFSGKALRQYGAAAIAEELAATPDAKCRSLDFSRNHLGDEGAQAVATLLKTFPALEELDVSFNDIGDDGAIALADALAQNSTLVSFSLHSVLEGSQIKPKLQEKGLCYLVRAIQGHQTLFNGTSAAVFLSRHKI